MAKKTPKRVRLFCPDGHEIKGTVEVVEGLALCSEALDHGPGEELELEYEGETKIEWDTQKSVYEEKERLFMCIEGELVRESQLKKKKVRRKPHAK